MTGSGPQKPTRDLGKSPQKTPAQLGFRMPAEWERHRGTWVIFPKKASDWLGKLEPMRWAMAEMVRQLVRGERVYCLVDDRRFEREAKAVWQRAGVALTEVNFVVAPTDRSWARDSLPTFVLGPENKRQRLGAVKWRFDGWNRYPDHQLDDRAGITVAQLTAPRTWYPEVTVGGRTRRVTLEGGSVDVDGEGTLLTTSECLLTSRRARHRSLGQSGSEELFARYLGVTKTIWLEQGIVGDDTSGHVDDFARFVGKQRVVLAAEPRRSDPNHRILAAARERLSGARDALGRRIEVIELPMPEPVGFRGVRLPASYANFYIGNECVVVPTFNDVADRRALGTLGELFPERRVVGIHALDWVVGLGTLHCSTQQQPG